MDILGTIYVVLTKYLVPSLFVFTIVVFFHELGHFLVARWCRIRVDAFSVGFGPEIVGFNDRRGTRWKLSAIPLGGYVKFAGDDNAASIPDPDELNAIPEEERRGLFYFSPLWKRTAVVVAGPVANFILAILIFAAAFVLIGRTGVLPLVDGVVADSAAEEAGFREGDLIVSIDGRSIEFFSDIQRRVALSSDRQLVVEVKRDDEVLTLTPTPQRREMEDGLGGTQRIGVLGVERSIEADDLIRVNFGPGEALMAGVGETYAIIEQSLTYIGRLLIGRETVDQLSGPVRIGQVSGVVAEEVGLSGLIRMAAILSVSIGLINLFPIPVLDGGHLALYAIEAVRGRPLSARAQEMSFRVGFAMIMTLFVFVTVNDILKGPPL